MKGIRGSLKWYNVPVIRFNFLKMSQQLLALPYYKSGSKEYKKIHWRIQSFRKRSVKPIWLRKKTRYWLGKKRDPNTIQSMKQTMFKKGQTPWNKGVITVDSRSQEYRRKYGLMYYYKHHHRNKIEGRFRRYVRIKNNHDEILQYGRRYYWKNVEKLRKRNREYARNNTRSGGSWASLEMQFTMNRVRKKQNNTCQWYGCGLTSKQTLIHVHHIFPRAKYPQYETEEWNLICYCKEHHAEFHKAKNDNTAQLILSSPHILVK